MKLQDVEKCAPSSDWNVLYWVLGSVLMPIALPLAIINLWQRFRAQKYRNQLPGKVVLITGASSGLGESLAHVFYRGGCKVILAARRIQELERVKNDLLALDVNPAYPPTVLALDLAELNSIPDFIKRALAVYNQVDILINNGGISLRADIASTAVDVDLKVMLVNYFGTVALTKALLPSMVKRRSGHFCFISSVQGKFAIPQRAAYSASKHAIITEMLIIVITLVTILLGLLYKWSTSTYHKFEVLGVPHEKPKPLLGNVRLNELLGSVSHLRRQLEQHVQFPEAKVYGTYFLRDPVFVVRDLELIKTIGLKEFDHFMNHHASDKFETIFSKSLVQLKNREWKDMRNILSPTFTGSKMRSMYELINACCEVSVEYIENQVKQEQEKGGSSIDLEMKDYCTRFTNDVIASAAFGIKVNSFEEKDNKFFKIGQVVTNIDLKAIAKSLLFTFIPWVMKVLRVSLIDEQNINYFRTLVNNAVNYRMEHNIIRPDMIQLLMEAQRKANEANEADSGKKFTDDDFLAQCLLFFFAGFETVSTALCFTTYELCMNPEVQEQLYEEILSAEEQLNGKPLDYDTLMHMKYLDMVVSESLRKWPPVTITDRGCNADIDLRDENDQIVLSLKKGDQVFIPILALHYDPEHFAEPEKFIPERFSDENKHDLNPLSYLPFGIGQRSCIGNRMALMEVKSLVYHLLTKFQLKPAEKTSKDMMKDIVGFQMVPKNKFWIKCVPRRTDVRSS